MDFISTQEAAAKWGVSLRYVQRLLHEHRIPDARKYGVSWLIPAGTEKPGDPRKQGVRAQTRYSYLSSVPLPKGKPEAALSAVPNGYLSLAEADLAYRRGNPEPAKEAWLRMDHSDERILTATILATVAAVSSGDYPLFQDIQTFLKERAAQTRDERELTMLSLPETLAAVSMALPDMTPDWLKRGDFSLFPHALAPFLLNLYTLHLRNIKNRQGVLAAARASVLLCAQTETFTWIDLDNLMLCAQASYGLGNIEEARQFLLSAMELGLPYGMTVPFADGLGAMGGLTEECLNAAYPEYAAPVRRQWEVGFKNWLSFHNRYASENITTLLNPREYQTAYLIAYGASYAEAAQNMNLSVGRLKNILTEVYTKLGINKREQLKDCIL